MQSSSRPARFLAGLLQQLQNSSAASNPAAAATQEPPAGGDWGEQYDFYKPSADVPLYNTCKQKLLDGEKVFCCPIDRFNVEGYLEARKHYDFIFFEMLRCSTPR